jgi:hypothetical protein
MKSSEVALVIIFCLTVIILVLVVSATALTISHQFGDRDEIQTAVAT